MEINNKNIHNKSLILIGGKAVGKTLISENLQKFTDHKILISLDDLFQYLMTNSRGGLDLDDETKILLKSMLMQKHLDPADENFITLKERFDKEFEDYYARANFYDKLLDIDSLSEITNLFYTIEQADKALKRDSGKKYNPNVKRFNLQVMYLELLDRCLDKITQSAIFDVGAFIGPVINLPEERFDKINKLFYNEDSPFHGFIRSGVKVQHLQEHVLKKIGTRIYVAGGKDYYETTSADVYSEDNLEFLSNPESYKKFATDTVLAENFFKTKNEDAFRNRQTFAVKSRMRVEELKIQKNIDEVCKKIAECYFDKTGGQFGE